MASESLLLNVFERIGDIATILAPSQVSGIMYWLAFLLIFVIIYNALMMTGRLFGEKKHSAMRLVISFTVAYIATLSPAVVLTIQRTFPPLSIFLIGIVALMFTLYFIFPENIATNFLSSNLMRLLVAGAVLMIFWVGMTGGGNIIEQREGGIFIGGLFLSDYDIALIILIGGFLLLIAWVFKGENQSVTPEIDPKKILQWLMRGGV